MVHPIRRGSALLVTVMVMTVFAIVAMGAISYTGKERNASMAVARAGETRACAEAARAHLLARFKLTGTSPTEISFVDTMLDSSTAADRSQALTGHYDQVNVTGATLVSSGMGASIGQSRDMTNLLADATTMGGKYYRVVVHCSSRGKQSEIEFLVRFGI